MIREEMEVTIGFNYVGNKANLYTSDPVWINKIDKLVALNPEQFKVIETFEKKGKIIAKKYEFPKRFVRIRSKDVQRNFTEEQRKLIRERLLGANKNKEKEEIMENEKRINTNGFCT